MTHVLIWKMYDLYDASRHNQYTSCVARGLILYGSWPSVIDWVLSVRRWSERKHDVMSPYHVHWTTEVEKK
jgi:hypothetical protein